LNMAVRKGCPFQSRYPARRNLLTVFLGLVVLSFKNSWSYYVGVLQVSPSSGTDMPQQMYEGTPWKTSNLTQQMYEGTPWKTSNLTQQMNKGTPWKTSNLTQQMNKGTPRNTSKRVVFYNIFMGKGRKLTALALSIVSEQLARKSTAPGQAIASAPIH
jgi:hypothetical protein